MAEETSGGPSFDVFLCHHSAAKRLVKTIGEKLKELGLQPWLDEWELRPGFSWQKALAAQIEQSKAVAVFVGKSGIGPWQDKEIEAFLSEGVRRECPIIPVILGNCKAAPELPIFLRSKHWVDFRKKRPDPLHQLYFGITGQRPPVAIPTQDMPADTPPPVQPDEAFATKLKAAPGRCAAVVGCGLWAGYLWTVCRYSRGRRDAALALDRARGISHGIAAGRARTIR